MLKYRVPYNPYKFKSVIESEPDGISVHSENLLPLLGINLEQINPKEITKEVSEELKKIISLKKEVWYRLCDFRSSDYPSAHSELNPALGVHGLRAYFIDKKYRSIWNAELKGIRNVDNKGDLISVYIPFVAKLSELKKFLAIVRAKAIQNQLGIMIEIPSAINLIPQLKNLGISFVSIGTGDLSQLFFGWERDNQALIEYFHDSYVLFAQYINGVIDKCAKAGLKVNLGGPQASNRDFLKHIDIAKLDSISITIPDMLNFRKSKIFQKLLRYKNQ